MTNNLESIGHNGNFSLGGSDTSISGIGGVIDPMIQQGINTLSISDIISTSSVLRAGTGGLSTVFSALQSFPSAQHLPGLLGTGRLPPAFELPSSPVFFISKGGGRGSGISR